VLATFDRHVDTDAPQDPGHSVRVGTDKGKLLQAASGRRIRARMGCGRVPLNEERKQALTRVCEIQGPPIQDVAIGAGTRAGSRPVERDSRLAKNLGKPIEVVLARRPADEPRPRHPGDAYELSHARLFWVRCHDLEVLALSEREEGVPRATAGMDAPNCGSDASVLLDKCDTAIEVVTVEDDVIQHGDAFVAARDRTGQKSRPDILHRNQAAESHHCMESLEDWLGGRDSNPDNVVQRADQPRRCAVIRIVSGRSRRAFRPPPSTSMRCCSTCLIVSHPARPLAAGLSGSRLAAPKCRYGVCCRPTQRFEQDQRTEHESAEYPLDFADLVSRRRPSIYRGDKPVQHVEHNTSVALHNTFVVSCLR
jgi:hypothetical protein